MIDYHNVKRADGAETHIDHHTGVLQDIGAELREEFDDIFPLLALLNYRWNAENGDFENYLIRVFQFDTLRGRNPLKAALGEILAPILWFRSKIKYRRKDQSVKYLFSNTFVKSPRYPAVYKSIDEKYGCIAVLTFYDTLESTYGNTAASVKKALKCDWGIKSPVFLPSRTVAGKQLEDAVVQYSTYTYLNRGEVNRQTQRSLLEALRKAYFARREWLLQKLKPYDIRCFFTINQYNLRDLLLIDVCDQIGAKTVQQEHGALQFGRINYDLEKPAKRLAFAQEYSMFDKGELNFHQLVFRYDNVLKKGQSVRFCASGNIELNYEASMEAAKRYPVQRKVLFVITALADKEWGTPEQADAIKRWRMAIFEQLHLLKEKTGVEVSVRYKPYCEMDLRAAEVPVLESYGIQVSPSLPSNLMEDICTSGIVISTTSTVLSTAISLGKTVYRVEDPGVTYLKVNPDVIDISVEDISSIPVSNIMEHKKILKENFFDIDRILQS